MRRELGSGSPGIASPTVLIWDPNPFNWYGSELARVIAGGAAGVVRYGRAGRAATGFGVTDRDIIPPPGGAHSAWGRVRFLYAIVEFVVRAVCSRSPVVVPWITTTAERGAVLALVLLTRRTVLIDHNPVPGRNLDETDALLRCVRQRAATVVVHGEDLVSGVGRCRRLRVAEHPGYVAWWRRYQLRPGTCTEVPPAATPGGRRPSALFLGSLRWDKGAADLPALAEALGRHGVELVVACGKAETELYEPLTNQANLRLVGDGHRYLTDDEIAGCLRESDVLVVPYTSVSRSGSLIMAATAQLPIVGYHSRGLTELAGEGAGVAIGDTVALADAVARSVSEPRAVPPGALADLESAARAGWLAVIAEVAS